MAKLINPSRQPVTLPTGHVVPRTGELVTTNDVLRCPDNVRTLSALVGSGAISAEYDVDPEASADEDTQIIATAAEKPGVADPAALDAPAHFDTPAKGKMKG